MKTEEAPIPVQLRSLPLERADLFDTIFTRTFFVVVADLVIGLVAYLFAWLARIELTIPFTTDLMTQEQWGVVGHPWLILVGSQVLFLYIMGLYDDLRLVRFREIVAFTFIVAVLQVAAVTSIFYFTEQVFPRSVVLLFDFLNFIFLCLWRTYLKVRASSKIRRVAIVSRQPESAREILNDIALSPWMRLEVVGLVTESSAAAEAGKGVGRVLGSLSEIDQIVNSQQIEEIIFVSEPSWRDEALDTLQKMRQERTVKVAILPSVYDMVIGKLRHINIHDTPLIEVRRNPNEPFERFLKRSFDFSFSALALMVLSPVFSILAVLIKLNSKGPVFYRQRRVGYQGRVFAAIKFRSMVADAEKDSGATYAVENDPRVTTIGRYLRRFRLDELPQLINVLRGDMSFVGPRPERPNFVRSFEENVPGYNERHKVKPGITGLAQVRSYYHTRAENKLKYDLAYIYNYSFSLDLLILLQTIKVVISGRGSGG